MDTNRVIDPDQGRVFPSGKIVPDFNRPQADGSTVTPTPGPAPLDAGVGSTSNILPGGNISNSPARQAFSPKTNKGIGGR